MKKNEVCKECSLANCKQAFFKQLKRYTALLSFLIGIILFSTQNVSTFHPALAFLGNNFIYTILENIGLALIVFAVFNIIVDTETWKAYFEDRLSDIVQTEAYLKQLDKETLNSLKTKIYKLLHGAEYISGEKSFFSYIDEKLSRLIDSNYRRDVVTSISVSVKEEEGIIFVEDTMQYTMVRVGDKLIDDLPWLFSKDEVVKLHSVSMCAIMPDGKDIILYCESDEKKLQMNESSYGGSGDLSKIDGLDKLPELKIRVIFIYEMNIDQYFIWQMTYPTYTYVVSINYPDNYFIQFDHFGLEDSASGKQDQTGLFTFRYDSWMLPRSGIVWGLLRKRKNKPRKQSSTGIRCCVKELSAQKGVMRSHKGRISLSRSSRRKIRLVR